MDLNKREYTISEFVIEWQDQIGLSKFDENRA